MKRFQKNSFVIAVGAALLLHSVGARAESIPLSTARTHHDELIDTLRSQTVEITSLSNRLDHVSATIRSLKGKKRTLLLDYRLQSSMQEAQRLSDRLQSMAKERLETEASLRADRKKLFRAIDSEIDRLREVAGSRTASTEERRTSAKEIDRLNWERMRLSTADPVEALPSSAQALMGNGDSPEEANERIAAIRDFEQRLKREINSMDEELKEMKRRRFLRAEVAHLMDEEAFFGESGFVSGGQPRTDKTGNLSVPSAGTVPSAGVAEAPSGDLLADARTRLDPSAASLLMLPSSELKMRDPLAQLATEFGISPEQNGEFSARAKGNLSDQIHWLERRLGATKQILTLLEEKVRKIEERHSH